MSPGDLGPARPKAITAHLFLTMPIGYCSLEAKSSPANHLSVMPIHLSLAQESGNGALISQPPCSPCLPPTDLLLFFVGPQGGVSDSRLLMIHLPLLIKKKQLRKKQFPWAGLAEIRLTRQVSANTGVGGDTPLSKPQIQV